MKSITGFADSNQKRLAPLRASVVGASENVIAGFLGIKTARAAVLTVRIESANVMIGG